MIKRLHNDHPPKKASQKEMFHQFWNFYSYGNLRNDDGSINSCDYYFCDTIEGIDYYTPNDEDWFHVVAVDKVNKLFAFTGFCEMDDFYSPYDGTVSDYAFVLDDDGDLKCKFEADEDE
jgi:hypothetical protein